MGDKPIFCLLLCATALTVPGVQCDDANNQGNTWPEPSLPVLLRTQTTSLDFPTFSEDKSTEDFGGFCGIECQSSLLPLDQTKQERFLGYETVFANGSRTHTYVTLRGYNQTTAPTNQHKANARSKRHVYGADGRFVISDSRFITNYPFSAAVRLSTGCSGVLVSPKHVLTAAHCIHNGRDYLEDAKRLKVGLLQLKTRRRRGRKKRGKLGRNDGMIMDQSSVNVSSVLQMTEKARRRRIRRSVAPNKQPVFRWTRVKESKIPQGWILEVNTSKALSSDYDYALLELKRPVKQKHMELGVAPDETSTPRIHFSGFDADKSHLDGRGEAKVVYRFCSVEKESADLIYQRCDAQTGATGAGVYVRLRRDGAQGGWQRRVIGVYSGHRWVEAGDGGRREFNVAVRINPVKFAQICHWMHEDPSLCAKM